MTAPSASIPAANTMSLESSVNATMNQKSGEDIIATLERLGGLMDKGYITKEEFETKKSELLGRI
jgi:hypothetical protein